MATSEEERIASRFRRLVELREKRDQDKEQAETSETEYREYEAELLDEIRDSPITGTRRIDLGKYGTVRFTPRETVYGRIVDADKAIEAFEREGLRENMTKTQISKSRLNEIVRDRLETGQPMPDGVDWYANRGFTITRPKNSAGSDDGSLDV